MEHVPRGTKNLYSVKKIITASVVDIFGKKVFPGKVEFENGKILSVEPAEAETDCYILPGLVDSHVHIESSMLTPQN